MHKTRLQSGFAAITAGRPQEAESNVTTDPIQIGKFICRKSANHYSGGGQTLYNDG